MKIDEKIETSGKILLIKDDINFLEYPNWIIDDKSKSTFLTIVKEHGKYTLTSPVVLPKRFDKIVLNFIHNALYKKNKLKYFT